LLIGLARQNHPPIGCKKIEMKLSALTFG
jgi:hypothetical protein